MYPILHLLCPYPGVVPESMQSIFDTAAGI